MANKTHKKIEFLAFSASICGADLRVCPIERQPVGKPMEVHFGHPDTHDAYEEALKFYNKRLRVTIEVLDDDSPDAQQFEE